MWNILIGALLTGSSLILYDGSPFYPSPAEHLKKVLPLGSVSAAVPAAHMCKALTGGSTTVLGGSPRFYDELQKLDIVPSKPLLGFCCYITSSATDNKDRTIRGSQ